MDLLRHTTFFVTIAEERHFGRAAARLGMTQPPLSQGLRRLEEHLGTRLFERSARDVTLTRAGETLLPLARRLVAAGDGLRRTAAARPEAPTLRLGVVAALPPSMVAGLVTALRRGAGGADVATEVEAVVGSTTDLAARVGAGRLDLAVVRHPGVLSAVTAGPVARLPTRLLVPSGRAGGDRVRLAALRGLALALPPRAHHPAAHDRLVDEIGRRGLHPSVLPVEDDRAALASVAADRAFAVVGDPGLSGAGTLSVAPGDDVALRVRAVWSPDAPPPTTARDAVVDVLRAAAPDPGGAP